MFGASTTTAQIVALYRAGYSYCRIGAILQIDRHKIPHVLRHAQEPLRRPWQGTKAEWSKHYEKTPRGFLMRAYRNMQSRVEGVQKRKAHLYQGLPILSRDAFYVWAWDDPTFWRLYKRWVEARYDRRLTPSVNRVDSTQGYVLGNIEWLTHSVNSSLGALSPRRRQSRALVEVYEHAKA